MENLSYDRTEKKLRALAAAKDTRTALLAKLEREGEDLLHDKLSECGKPLNLLCTSCGRTHHAESRCKQKWCPTCARAIATKRSLKYQAAIEKMQWPLFVTLTARNAADDKPEYVRELRRAFGRLRHRKMWRHRVKGGVAAIEVTNRGNGWHFHLHAVIDCDWLAWKTPPLTRGMSRRQILRRLKQAHRELSSTWAKCLGHDTAVVWVKRAHGGTIAREVLKYSVKGSDLIGSVAPIGPLIRALTSTRLVTSFGTLFGKLREAGERSRSPLACAHCGESGTFVLEEIILNQIRTRK